MHQLVAKAHGLLKDRGFFYAVCGGQAIDLFLGYESRPHGDLDFLAYWPERDAIILFVQSLGFDVYEMLGGGRAHRITDVRDQRRVKRNIICCKPDCDLARFFPAEEKDIYQVDFQHARQTRLDFLEFLFNDRDGENFLYARDHQITRNLADAILRAGDVPYLAPELCLLYKSIDPQRAGYQQDFDLAFEAMHPAQRAWLQTALRRLYPQGHAWIR